jgi:peptidoglycan hydrolase-like protein with peptidoglycan-binding domain
MTERGAAAFVLMRRREIVGLVMAAGATLMIFVNALFLQHGPHPAPIFATRPAVKQVQPAPAPLPAPKNAAENAQQQQLIANIQRELSRRGFYDGSSDGVWGARTDAALRDFLQAAGLKINAEPNEAMLRAISTSTVKAADARALPKDAAPNDPIAQLLAPSKRVLAIQRALADFGYGQIKPTGLYDPDTHAAIERFQRERRLPVTGDISDELVRELAAVTGRPLE